MKFPVFSGLPVRFQNLFPKFSQSFQKIIESFFLLSTVANASLYGTTPQNTL